jgi:hypothetical protein
MISPTYMKPALLSAVTVSLFTTQIFAQDGILREGTPVRLQLNRTISSAAEHQGDRVDFEVLDDVKAGDALMIPHGSTALATVTEAVPKGRMGKGGKLNVNIDFVRLPNGDKLPLRGMQEGKGGGHTGAMAGAMVGTAIVFWPAAPLFLLMHGKDITIPKGHEVTVYTSSDYKPGAAMAAASSVSASGAAGMAPAITNTDILTLKEAGFSEQLMIAKIKSTSGNYQLDTDNLMKLKKAGISDAVMAAMMQATH